MKEEKPNNQGFNEHTLEWRGRKLKELHHKELIDIIVHFFKMNLAMQQKLKAYENAGIIQTYRN